LEWGVPYPHFLRAVTRKITTQIQAFNTEQDTNIVRLQQTALVGYTHAHLQLLAFCCCCCSCLAIHKCARSEATVSPSGNTLETSAGGSSYVMWSWALIQQLTAAENVAEKYNDAKETEPRCSMQCASWLHRSVEFEGHRKYVCELQRAPTAALGTFEPNAQCTHSWHYRPRLHW